VKAIHELCLPDARNENLRDDDPQSGDLIPWTLERCYASIGDIDLAPELSAVTHSSLNAAKMVYVYSWFYYPLATLAGLLATITCERGLRVALGGTRARLPTLLERSLRNGWIRDEDFPERDELAQKDREMWEALQSSMGLAIPPPQPPTAETFVRELLAWRHAFLHPRDRWLITPGMAKHFLSLSVRIVLQVTRRAGMCVSGTLGKTPQVETPVTMSMKAFDAVCQPDRPRWTRSYFERHMRDLELPEDVPEPVRDYHDAVRTLYLYSYYYAPLMSLVPLFAMTEVELALKRRLPWEAQQERTWFDTRTLAPLLRQALAKGLLREGDLPTLSKAGARSEEYRAMFAAMLGREPRRSKRFTVKQQTLRLTRFRNFMVHSYGFSTFPPPMILPIFRDTTELIAALWRGR
jgi:hypothetical protein